MLICSCYCRKTRPKLTARIFWQLFLCALIGLVTSIDLWAWFFYYFLSSLFNHLCYCFSATFTQYLSLLGIKYTSATFACAFINMVPVLTFLSALPFGYVYLDRKSKIDHMSLQPYTVVTSQQCHNSNILAIFGKYWAIII